jgi:hypothetical protein
VQDFFLFLRHFRLHCLASVQGVKVAIYLHIVARFENVLSFGCLHHDHGESAQTQIYTCYCTDGVESEFVSVLC